MTGMSERAHARHIGRSRGSVQKLCAAGRRVLLPDGSIDAAASDARRKQTADPARQPSQPQPAAERKPVPDAAVGAVAETLKEQGLPAPAVAGGMTYLQARTANEVLKAQERRLRLQKLRGEVVDRATACATVFRLARQERDAWLGWPARIAATIAAKLGIGRCAAGGDVAADHRRERFGRHTLHGRSAAAPPIGQSVRALRRISDAAANAGSVRAERAPTLTRGP